MFVACLWRHNTLQRRVVDLGCSLDEIRRFNSSFVIIKATHFKMYVALGGFDSGVMSLTPEANALD